MAPTHRDAPGPTELLHGKPNERGRRLVRAISVVLLLWGLALAIPAGETDAAASESAPRQEAASDPEFELCDPDAMLRWQTKRFLDLEIGREGQVVHVRPEQVVEIAFDAVQHSPRYPSGAALRFARVKRYRDDKSADAADTIEAVRDLLPRLTGGGPSVS